MKPEIFDNGDQRGRRSLIGSDTRIRLGVVP